MKIIFLNSKSSEKDLYTYGSDLMNKLQKNYNVVLHNDVKSDFSNIPELFDESEKLVLFNEWSFTNGFTALTTHLPSFRNVKYILSPYSSFKGLNLHLLKKLGIKYRNNAGANAKSVAQYAVTAMFMLLRRFPELTKTMVVPDGLLLGEEYNNKTAGIIGMGKVGVELQNILNNLGIPTAYYNRTNKKVNAKKIPLKEIFKQDIVFITIAGNPDTKKLLKGIPKLIQKHSYLVDISASDDLYDKNKVIKLLNENKLKGYAIEMYDPSAYKVKSGKNLILSPHIAWTTVDAEKRTVENYLKRAHTILKGDVDKVDFLV